MVINKIVVCFLFLPLSVLSQANANRYFVSFKDKANTPYSVSNPLQFLSQKSIDRRVRENFVITSEDFPVDSTYVHQVKKTGAAVYFTSRWLNGVLIQTSVDTAGTVATLPFVANVELVAPGLRLTGGRKKLSNKFEQARANGSTQNQLQLQMIGVDKMQAAGYHGEGVDVAVFDAGFIGVNTLPAFQALYQEGRLKTTFNFVKNISDVYTDYNHGTEVLSIMAGNSSSYLGGIYKANYYLFETEDVTSEYRVEEYNWLFAAERADSLGVDVINSSLGYNQFDDPSMDYTYQNLDGKTAVVSRAAHMAFERGISVVNSAGNDGGDSWKYIIVPADAVGVIACAAVDVTGQRSSFSSIGPSADGRIKPDVAAVGGGAVIITATGFVSTDDGTSFSSPLITCLVVGLRQALPDAPAKEIYQLVINSASQASHPDDLLGYGIPNFTIANGFVSFQDEFDFFPNPVSGGVIKIMFKEVQGETFTATIFNSSGQRVLQFSDSISWDNNPYPIDISSFAAGLYYARIQKASSAKTLRIVRIN